MPVKRNTSHNHPFAYSIIKSSRKTISIEIRPDCSILVRAPQRASMRQIDLFLTEKESWVLTHLEKMQKRQQQTSDYEKLSAEELDALFDQAARILPAKVSHYASLLHVTYGRITIRNQRTRWGSCSSLGNLNFNCLLMLAPEEVIDYIVVHELCHRIEMNHSQAFWKTVEGILPDYKIQNRWLKEHGSALMACMP